MRWMGDDLHKRRARLFAFVTIGILTLLVVRLAWIQFFRHDWYAERASGQHLARVVIPAERGPIVDSRGRTLATTLAVNSVYVEPERIQNIPEAARKLSEALDLDVGVFLEKLEAKKEKKFMWVKRKVTEEEAGRVRELHLAGVGLRREGKRVYPQGKLACHVLGFTDLDGVGLEGVEKSFSAVLAGRDGYKTFLRDGKGKLFDFGGGPEVSAEDGSTLVLTLDSVIQHFAEEALERTSEERAPVSATAIVMRPASGEILAMANWPAFDPNSAGSFPPESRRNRAIADSYEPGSTFKPIVMAAALEERMVEPTDKFFCYDGLYVVRSRRLHDHHPYGWLTVRDILVKSSNIGMAQIGQVLGAEKIYSAVIRFGFGKKTGIALSGEETGKVRPLSQWSYYSETSIPMGQEITVTPLQLASGFNAIASGGVRMKPTIVKGYSDPSGKVLAKFKPVAAVRTISEGTSRRLTEIMTGVVDEGTGTRARIEGYAVAGKTGTAQKVVEGIYSHSKFISSFVCFAPAEEPKVLVLVMVNEPSKGNSYYGGTVAAPVAAEIMERTLYYLGVKPSPTRLGDTTLASSKVTGD